MSWQAIGSWLLNFVMYAGAAGVIWKGYQMLRKVDADKKKTESEAFKISAEANSIQIAAAKTILDEWRMIALNYKKDFEGLEQKIDLERVECDKKLDLLGDEIRRLERMIKK